LLAAKLFGSNSTPTSGQSLPHDAPPGAISARVLCTLSNEDAASALVAGGDGGTSVVVGDKTWWLFGDTLFEGRSGKQIEANSIASSQGLRPDGCPRLAYYAPNGTAIPFIEKDGSLTVWPTGAWPSGNEGFDFYIAYVYGSGPYSYSVDEIGVGHFDTATLATTILSRRLWTKDSGFESRVLHVQPVEVASDGGLRLILHTEGGTKLLARVEPARIADATAYEYWDGADWTTSPADATSLWQTPSGATDIEKLALFENGASIAWNEALQRYVALVNTGFQTIGARTAARLEGPWSEPVMWLDCLAFVRLRVPTCYSPQQHPSLATNNGGTLVATISAIEPYQMHVVEITLGTPVHEYQRGSDVRYGITPPADEWEDLGVAFYAATTAAAGTEPVYRWQSPDATRYGIAAPGPEFKRMEIAFYSPPNEGTQRALVRFRPVYSWEQEATQVLSPLVSGLEQYGYTRGDVMFYAP
jgi:hypothetical protein